MKRVLLGVFLFAIYSAFSSAHLQTVPLEFNWTLQLFDNLTGQGNTVEFASPVQVINATFVYCCFSGGINATLKGNTVYFAERGLHACSRCSNDVESVEWVLPPKTVADKLEGAPYGISIVFFLDIRGTKKAAVTQQDEAKSLGAVEDLIDTANLKKIQAISSNPEVMLWLGGPDDFTRSETDTFGDTLFACTDLDQNKKCDFVEAEKCQTDGGDFYRGKCCGVDFQCGQAQTFGSRTAFCGRTANNASQWVTPEEAGEIHDFGCPKEQSVHTGAEIKHCGSDTTFTITKGDATHEYFCRNETLTECGAKSPFSSINRIKLGQKFLGEYCASDGDFAIDIDPKDADTCAAAGFKYTGSKCCMEPEDKPEFYNDASFKTSKTPGGCFASQYVEIGRFAKKLNETTLEDKRIINYNGSFVFCNPSELTLPEDINTLTDNYTNAPLLSAVGSCGAGLPSARPTGIEKHAKCELNGLFSFSANPAATIPKPVPKPPYASLVLNAGFDAGLESWTAIAGQDFLNFGAGDIVVEQFRFGKQNISKTSNTGTSAAGIKSAFVIVESQQDYSASADVFCTEGTGQLTIYFETPAAQRITQTVSTSSLNAWERISITAGALGANKGAVVLHTPQQQKSTCFFDDVVLEIGEPKPLPKDIWAAGCCAQLECWNGRECQQNNTVFDAGDDGFFCANGTWKLVRKKFSPDRVMGGYCPENPQCLVHVQGNTEFNNQPEKFFAGNPNAPTTLPKCLNHSQYIFDNICNDGDWTSRSKLLAVQLLALASQINAKQFTISCETGENALNAINYDPGRGLVAQFVAKPCVIGNKLGPCVNNFCVLKLPEGVGAIATSSNIPIDSPQSILKALNTSENSCNTARKQQAGTGLFGECSPSPPIAGKIWYNPDINSIVYLPPTLQTSLNMAFTPAQLGDILRFVFETKHNPNSPLLNLSFFNRTTILNTLLFSQSNDRNIFAFLEQNQTSLRLNYLGVIYQNISLGEDPCLAYVKRADTLALCENQTSPDAFVIVSKTNKIAALFADLSSKLRLV